MIAPGPVFQSDEDSPTYDWEYYFATTFVTAVLMAVGTKVGEWAVEALRKRVEAPKDEGPT